METAFLNGRAHVFRFVALVAFGFMAGCIIDIDLDDEADVFVSESFSINRDASGYDRLVLRGVNGTIDVAGRVGLDDFIIEGERSVGAGSRRSAERYLEDLEVDIFRDGEALVVQTDQPRDTRGRQYVVDYVITVPADMGVEIENLNGDIYVADVDNFVFVDQVNGEVALINVYADVDVRVTNGLISAEVIVPDQGFVDLGTTNGPIELFIPHSTSADLDARVTNGRILISGLTLRDVSESPRSFSARLGTGRGEIDLQTVNGDIRVEGRNFGRTP